MKHKFYRPILYYFLLVVKWFFNLLPYRVGFSFGGTAGQITFYLLKKEREKTLGHLRMAFGGEKSETQIRKIGLAVFEHYGQTMAELALIDKILARLDEFVTAEGFENFDKALQGGRGVICTLAHFGNWEIMGGFTAIKGYPCVVVAREIYFDKYNELLISLRRKLKMEVIYRDSSPRTMLGVLKKNKMLGFVVDQDVETVEGVFVNFFNRPSFTPVAPVRFAMVTGAPIVPVFIIRNGIKHHVIVEPALEMTVTKDKESDIRVNTQRWVSIQEKYIRQYPHLWVWNHKRWKTGPASS